MILSLIAAAAINAVQLNAGSITVYQPSPLVSGSSNYVLVIGQSNARGWPPAISLVQPYNNSMWTMGVCGADDITAAVGSDICTNFYLLTEGSFTKETPCSGFANQVHVLVGNSTRDLTIGDWGQNGQPYSVLKKGGTGTTYGRTMASVTNYHTLVPAGTVTGILCVHGESDSGSSTYSANLYEWQKPSYEDDIKAITGQTGIIPMFHTQVQMNDWPGGMLNAYETNQTRVILVGPKYAYPYQPTGTHLQNYAYTVLGELYAKAYYKAVVLGQTWSPLRPISTAVTGSVISITYTGLVSTLVFDTNIVAAATDNMMGYEYFGGADGRTIVSVAIAATNRVDITLSGPPGTTTGERIAYAYTGAPYGPIAGGCRGNLRDADTLVGRSGTNLYNWGVHFYKPLNWTSP